jgi:hypothetical protein
MRKRRAAVVAALLAGAATPAAAHHSIAAVYDSSREVTVEGRVAEFLFVNPHPVLVIDSAEPGAEPRLWRLEMDNRGELADVGIDAKTFTPGERVVARGSAARKQPQGLYLLQLDRPADGFRYEQIGYRPRVTLGAR